MKLHVTQVLVGPVVSEKATNVGEFGQHVFRVNPDATKADIRAAVETLFEVSVKEVRTLRGAGKVKRFRGRPGQRAGWKKAYVTLAEGQAIAVAEGAQ